MHKIDLVPLVLTVLLPTLTAPMSVKSSGAYIDFQTTQSNSSNSSYPEYVGFICAGISVLFYGSNFVPVKHFDTGDGMFFQWILCIGVFLSGLVLQIIQRSTFYPLAMVGGVIWATGNICVVPIIKTIGMGLGLCIWGMFNLLTGWASGRFGLFGINKEIPQNEVFNYIGVALAVSSSVIYMFVRNEVSVGSLELVIQEKDEGEQDPLLSRSHLYGENPQEDVLVFNKHRSNSMSKSLNESKREKSIFERLTPGQKKTVGIILCVVSGLMYGISFTPAIYCQDNYGGASTNSLDYVFAHFSGIFLASNLYFIIYIIIMKNQPKIYPQVILPGIVSGILWAIATASWFIANRALSEPVAFPIIATGPGAIASLFWGVLIFHEIKGKRNIFVLLCAFSVTMAGSILAGISH